MAEIAEVPVLDQPMKDRISALLQDGRRVSEVIGQGLAQTGGWRRQHVIAVISENGWALDSDGRIPRRFRTSALPPATPLPGQPVPEPPRRPVVEFPPEGTVTEGRGANAAAAMIATGKAHQAGWIRKLAEKAETALDDLRTALKQDEQHAVVRNRLAQLEAEAERLRAQLPRGVGRPKGTGTRKAPSPPTAATLAKPINHGTWGGYLQHTKRGIPIPADDSCGCNAAKDRQMAKLKGTPDA